MSVDSKQSKMLRSYGDVVNFLLPAYATDEVIAEAYNDVVIFRQSSAMAEAIYSRML